MLTFDYDTRVRDDGTLHKIHFFSRVNPGAFASILERPSGRCGVVYQRFSKNGRRYESVPSLNAAKARISRWVRRNEHVLINGSRRHMDLDPRQEAQIYVTHLAKTEATPCECQYGHNACSYRHYGPCTFELYDTLSPAAKRIVD